MEKGKPSKEEKAPEERERETEKGRFRVRFWEGKKGEIRKEIPSSRREEIAYKKKRSSARD